MESLNKLYIYQYVDAISSAFSMGKTAKLDIIGSSMLPTLKEGDKVIIDKPLNLSVNDIVLYHSAGNNYVLHRIININDKLTIMGDNNLTAEYVDRQEVIAKVVKIEHNNKIVNTNSISFKVNTIYVKFIRLLKRIKSKVKYGKI